MKKAKNKMLADKEAIEVLRSISVVSARMARKLEILANVNNEKGVKRK